MSRLEMAAVACFVLGAGLLFPFDSTVTILLGVLLLFASIVCGVFALASPERLAAGLNATGRSSPRTDPDDPSAPAEKQARR
jgi:hypothetical protein